MSDASTLQRVLIWLGFAQTSADEQRAGAHGQAGGHGHRRGVIDATIATTDRGIWAIKWSFAVLAATALFQASIVLIILASALVALDEAVDRLPFTMSEPRAH